MDSLPFERELAVWLSGFADWVSSGIFGKAIATAAGAGVPLRIVAKEVMSIIAQRSVLAAYWLVFKE
jgi:hypothetical protein